MRTRAFSLPELLCVLALGGILLALAAPSWRRQMAEVSVTAAARQSLAGLALARRTALASGRTITLCLTLDRVRCDLRGREWMLFANGPKGSLARREAAEPLLQRWPLPREVRVSGTRGHAYYLPQPRAAATLTFEFCHPAWPTARRGVVVSQTGRPRLTLGDPTSRPPPSRCP